MGVVMLVRHGQAVFGSDDDAGLSSHGVTQSRVVARTLADFGVRPTVIIHGCLRSHRESAEAMLQATGWEAPVEGDDRWNEFDHRAVISAYPALSDAELSWLRQGTTDPGPFQQIVEKATARWTSGTHDEDYPESFLDFLGRIRGVLAQAGRRAGPRRTAIVVTSGGPIAAAGSLLTMLGSDRSTMSAAWRRLNSVIVNGSVTRVVVGSTGARMLTFNEHSHLDRVLVTYL